MKKKPRCHFCGQTATLAFQYFYTNRSIPVNRKTAQVRARPDVCYQCAMTKLRSVPLIMDNYSQCRQKIIEIAQNNQLKNTILLFAAKKYQQV